MSASVIDRITSKETLMGLLYALHDSGYWSASQFSDWATEVLISSDDPALWTLELIAVKDQSDVEHAFHQICKRNNILVPSWIYDVAAGFIVLRKSEGHIDYNTAIGALGDLADAYGICGLTPEEVYADFELSDFRLCDARSTASALYAEIEKRPISKSVLASAL